MRGWAIGAGAAALALVALFACSQRNRSVSSRDRIAPAISEAAAVDDAATPSAAALRDGETFRDCAACPDMVVIPAGAFTMGSPANQAGRASDEGPQRQVSIQRFAASKYEITFAQWDACVAAGGCDDSGPRQAGGDNGWGRGRQPVIEVNWNDARAYAHWLRQRTGQDYRLLTEAEWEYAARAGTTTTFSTGATITPSQAQYWWSTGYGGAPSRNAPSRTAAVGSFPANAFGLHDMHGNVWEWVQDCYAGSYVDAPLNGSAFEPSKCWRRVLRGGSWFDFPQHLRSANRSRDDPTYRYRYFGIRLARTISNP